MKNVVISDKEKLENLKKIFAKQGKTKIYVLSDFDRTLTKYFVNGKKVPSLISILRDEGYLTKDYSAKAHALADKYRPIEKKPDIPLEEKKKAMHEWWKSHYKLLIKCKLNKKDIEDVVMSEKIQLRKGALKFIDVLHKNGIPLVIMSSAGLGKDSISLFFEKRYKLYDNIYIISNELIWDEKGYMIGVKEPIIHSMNKDEIDIKKDFPSIYEKIKDRKNILLIGNNLEDANIAKNFEYDNIIKMGFLNKDVDSYLQNFKEVYDVVILNDGSFRYINNLVKEILKED